MDRIKTLHLTLKKKWFDMIASGIKKEEYREIKQHWVEHLMLLQLPLKVPMFSIKYERIKDAFPYGIGFKGGRINSIEWLMRDFSAEFKQFEDVSATNGYGHHRPNIKWKNEGIRIGKPNPEWCEPEDIGKTVFILEIGKIIEVNNPELLTDKNR